jgi:lysyl-tRNA synthetase class 1
MSKETFHWVENISEEIIKRKKEPFVITCGATLSGPMHLGTLCEILYPSLIAKFLQNKGYKVKFIFFSDDYDAFDSIPFAFKQLKFLKEHLGKPLVKVQDPLECHKSYAEHMLEEVKEVIEKLEIDPKPKIVSMYEYYKKGKFDSYAINFIKDYDLIRKIVFETSLKEDKGQYWHPLMVVCKNCGKIATTRINKVDLETEEIHYVCDLDVDYTKGCGYQGTEKFKDHNWKLTWRLHWPAEMDLHNTSAEGAGRDHHTKGGSWDTCKAIFEKYFKKEPPVTWKHGLILYHGKKYSKSKGIGTPLRELIEIVPPQVIKYIVARADIESDKNIDPNVNELLKVFNELKELEELKKKLEKKEIEKEELSRAQIKKLTAYSLIGEIKWKEDISTALINYQLAKEVSTYLKKYIERWFELSYVPEDLKFEFKPKEKLDEEVIYFISKLNEKMDAKEIHDLVYKVAEELGKKPNELFKKIYLNLIRKEKGPRLGKLIEAIGIKKVKNLISNS